MLVHDIVVSYGLACGLLASLVQVVTHYLADEVAASLQLMTLYMLILQC